MVNINNNNDGGRRGYHWGWYVLAAVGVILFCVCCGNYSGYNGY